MSLKTILHSDLAKALARMAADKLIGHDVAKELYSLAKGGVLPEGANHAKLSQMVVEGVQILGNLDNLGSLSSLDRPQTARPDPQPMQNAAGESPKPYESGFVFGAKSRVELFGTTGKPPVKVMLANVVGLALRRSTRDFTVYEGSRTLAKQKEYVAKGTSKTLKSAHLPQEDGMSHAIDLVPIVNGVPSWASWEAIYEVALAMDIAATELGVAEHIVWGCAWDRRLSDFGGNVNEYAKAAIDYGNRQRAAGNQHPLIDGPHFEWRA